MEGAKRAVGAPPLPTMLSYINRKCLTTSQGGGLTLFLKNAEKHFLKTDLLDFLLGWKFNLHRFRAQRAHYQGGGRDLLGLPG